MIRTVPDTFAQVEAVDDPLLIRFNERISERTTSGALDRAVVVSPRTGEVRVQHARDALEVDLSGGFRPGLVYRVTVLPVIQDMFGNTMPEPFEFVFSTGAEFTPNVVAGFVLERTTGLPAEGYRVRARSTDAGADTSVVHVAVTDTAGFFALRYLPPGRYDLTAFQDLNRNEAVDFAEARGSRSLLFRQADTIPVELPVLRPDTSRAVLGRVTAEAPRSLRLEFDDFLDPDAPTRGVAVVLARDSAPPIGTPPPPAVERVLHPPAWEAWRDSVTAGDSGAVPEAQRRIPRPGEVPTTPGQERGRVAGEDLPRRELIVVLEAPLPANVPYRITVSGVVNINGVPFGGGTGSAVRQPEPADTTAAPGDTTAVPGDTVPAADTAGAPRDTVPSGAADTVPAPGGGLLPPPDTLSPPPDTVAPGPVEPPADASAPAPFPRPRSSDAPSPPREAVTPAPDGSSRRRPAAGAPSRRDPAPARSPRPA